MKSINTLINEFNEMQVSTNTQRNEVIKNLIVEHGYEKVSEATGYKMSTLVAIKNGQNILIADVKVRQAEYVFRNLNVE